MIFYEQNGRFIGSDSSKDDQIAIITDPNEVEMVASMLQSDEREGLYALNSSVLLPPLSIRQEMGKAIEKSNAPNETDLVGGLHEEGGVLGKDKDGTQQVIHALAGDVFVKGKGGAGVNPFNSAEINNTEISVPDYLNLLPIEVEGTFHVHPKGNDGVSFYAEPSKTDLENAVKRRDLFGITGQHYVLGLDENKVYIYQAIETEGKVVASFPIDAFLSVGETS